MRNVNKGISDCSSISAFSFILTMRNVNLVKVFNIYKLKDSFILTMRNVNKNLWSIPNEEGIVLY